MVIIDYKNSIEDFYGEDLLEHFNILKLDDNGFILQCLESHVKLAFIWSETIKQQEKVLIKEGKERLDVILYHNLKYDKDILESSNSKLKIYKDKGFYINEYSEFLIHYYSQDMNEFTSEFMIGRARISFNRPSYLFRLIFHHFSNDDYFIGWSEYCTVSITNASKDELEGILQQALFIIGKFYPPEIEDDYPNVIAFEYEEGNYLEEPEIDGQMMKVYEKTKYYEALAFYNKARKTGDTLFYYKVLEYFFIINRKEEFQELIAKYNIDENIDFFIESVTSIYHINESIMLKNLLSNLSGLDEVINKAFHDELIELEDLNHFVSKLYDYRNSIAHGKSGTRFKIVIPSIILTESEEQLWEQTLRMLAEKVINHFC